jgi:cobyrinic acid a,c-diamide synthase
MLSVNLPRLIIADEINEETISPGVILAYALKRAGVKVKVFTCARSETDLRLLKLLLEEPVVSLDLYTCGTIRNLKTLFQKTADPDALNVILVPLGTRPEEDFVQIRPEPGDLVKALSCGVVLVLAASASAVLTANTAFSALSAFDGLEENPVMGVLFASVKNPREYQLLEQDYGRKTALLSLGYIPKEIERSSLALQDLYGAGAATRVMQIKSAALQLASVTHQVDWEILEAFGYLKQDWTPPQETDYLIKNFKIAVVGDHDFSLEGDNSRELFQFLGCEVVDYNPWQDLFPLDAEALYFPHSMAGAYVDKLMTHRPFVHGVKQSLIANKLMFANGASALLFGQYLLTSDGVKHEALKIFPFWGGYAAVKKDDSPRRIEVRATADSIFTKKEEKMRGYALEGLHVGNPGNVVPPVWAYRDIRRDTELGTSGWVKGYCFVTDLNIELWSNIDVVNRWLSLRKR